jgi:hypothetical protein
MKTARWVLGRFAGTGWSCLLRTVKPCSRPSLSASELWGLRIQHNRYLNCEFIRRVENNYVAESDGAVTADPKTNSLF